MTKEIEKAARKQYSQGSDLNIQKIIAKFFAPNGWRWYLMNQDPDHPDYLWGIVKGYEVEMGSFSLSELELAIFPFGMKIERDISFKPLSAQEVWERLNKGEFV
jgi:hypothetical protein